MCVNQGFGSYMDSNFVYPPVLNSRNSGTMFYWLSFEPDQHAGISS